MRLSNITVKYYQAINPDICDKIISLGLSKIDNLRNRGILTTGMTRNQVVKKDIDIDISNARKSEVTGLSDKWLYDLFAPFIGDANKKAGWNWHIDAAENFQFAIYEGSKENGGFYAWHSDGPSDFLSAYKPAIKISNDPIRFKQPRRDKENKIILDENGKPEADMNTQDLPLNVDKSGLPSNFSDTVERWGKVRKISMTVNLSDPKTYEGGNLKIDKGPYVKGERYVDCHDIRPQGSVICFPSFTNHCVEPVTSGTRYSLVLWCLGKPFQ
tara:strand:+ start:201 stop:1013 length:813 start_codon:yes stop_codon:yes gene_type:complete